jgi:bis(5'-nucleosyl)-tetraphosphatase (symmetrical)
MKFILSHQDNFEMVLGNHDIHLIACHFDSKKIKQSDNFEDILNSGIRDKVIEYLLNRSLALQLDESILIHAGVPPIWSKEDVFYYSDFIKSNMQSSASEQFINSIYSNKPKKFKDSLTVIEKSTYAINALTRMRFCSKHGEIDYKAKGNFNLNPSGYKAWFLHRNKKLENINIFFGHWSTLKGFDCPKRYHLDTGCVWGNKLTAIRFEDKQIFSVNCN